MDGRRLVILRIAAFFTVLVVLFAVVALTGSFPSAGDIRDWGESLGPFAVLACVPTFVLLNFAVTWSILAGATGLLFGTAGGTPLALAGVTCAALIQMAISRYLAGDHAGQLLPERLRPLESFLERSGTVAIMESRILPLLPWGAVNYVAGLTSLQFRQMGIGTVVGATPKVFGYVALGGSLDNLDSTEAKVAIGLLLALGVAGLMVARVQLHTERRS